jgi:hypothetical protein
MRRQLVTFVFCLAPISLFAQEPTSQPPSAPSSAPASEPALPCVEGPQPGICESGDVAPGEEASLALPASAPAVEEALFWGGYRRYFLEDGSLRYRFSDAELHLPEGIEDKDPQRARSRALGASVGAIALGAPLGVGSGFLVATLDPVGGVIGVAGLLLGSSLVITGLTVGPSAGHLYAGELQHTLRFTLRRVAALGVGLVGVTTFFAGCCVVSRFPENDGVAALGVATTLVGAGGYLYYTTGDIVDAPYAVIRQQRRLRLTRAQELASQSASQPLSAVSSASTEVSPDTPAWDPQQAKRRTLRASVGAIALGAALGVPSAFLMDGTVTKDGRKEAGFQFAGLAGFMVGSSLVIAGLSSAGLSVARQPRGPRLTGLALAPAPLPGQDTRQSSLGLSLRVSF